MEDIIRPSTITISFSVDSSIVIQSMRISMSEYAMLHCMLTTSSAVQPIVAMRFPVTLTVSAVTGNSLERRIASIESGKA